MLTFFVFSAGHAIAKTQVENYLIAVDHIIGEAWLKNAGYLDPYFRRHNKAVLSFVLNKQGFLKNIRVKHSTKETFFFAARTIYKERAEEKLQLVDQTMIEALKKTSPLPSPPRELSCPRRFAVIFDSPKPPRVLMDDEITEASQLRNTIQ